MYKHIAVLITCFNRVEKTITCLESLYKAKLPKDFQFDVFLVDDGSTDGTTKAVKEKFPAVIVIKGTGKLFWAGGMRLAWKNALNNKYFGYLLLNDDTILYKDVFIELLNLHMHCRKELNNEGIYVGTTQDPISNDYTYGAYRLTNKLSGKSIKIKPETYKIQFGDFSNANILFISKKVVDTIGILSDKFTHKLADYDYTLKATKKGFPLLVGSSYCGTCEIDHGNDWLPSTTSFKERVKYLKDPKFLAYTEYLFYIRYHFPLYFPISYIKLWIKTLFPIIWDKFKT